MCWAPSSDVYQALSTIFNSSHVFHHKIRMNRIEATPQINHDGGPKRRRIDPPTTPANPHIDDLIPRCNYPPLASPQRHSSPQKSSSSDSECDDDPLLTQPPPIVNPQPPSCPAQLSPPSLPAAKLLESTPPIEPLNAIQLAMASFESFNTAVPFDLSSFRFCPHHPSPPSEVT